MVDRDNHIFLNWNAKSTTKKFLIKCEWQSTFNGPFDQFSMSGKINKIIRTFFFIINTFLVHFHPMCIGWIQTKVHSATLFVSRLHVFLKKLVIIPFYRIKFQF